MEARVHSSSGGGEPENELGDTQVRLRDSVRRFGPMSKAQMELATGLAEANITRAVEDLQRMGKLEQDAKYKHIEVFKLSQ